MATSSSLCCEICGAVNETDAHLCFACHHPLLTLQAPISAHPTPDNLFTNTLLKDRYHIIAKVGAGGFGSVYKAADTLRQGHLVAIKEVSLKGLHPQAILQATDAFHREVSFLSKLTHPSLPRLYEHFSTHEHWFLVMDFVEGETLEEYQKKAQNQRLLLSEVLNIGLQLCTVLEYLHEQQPPVIFRDLKPANIIRTSSGQLYLIDFGIARHFKLGQPKDTTALGSIGYSAPEQYGKAQTTPCADIYSLGAVLHELLTAKDPSEAPFRFIPLRAKDPQRFTDPGSLTTSMVDIHMNHLQALITSMLEMDVNKRPASVAVVKQELKCIADAWSDINKSFWRPRLGNSSISTRSTTSQK